MSAGGPSSASRPARTTSCGIYVKPLARLGHRRLFSTNRYARYGFLTTLRLLERRLGIPPDPEWATARSGARFLCHLHDNLESELFYLGGYAVREIATVARYLEPGDVFLDVGAHVGLFAVEIARHLGDGGTVIAFEPSPDSASSLRRNAEANGVQERITVVDLALGDMHRTLPLRATEEYPLDAGRRSLFADGTVVSQVFVRTLDELVASSEVRLERGLQAIKIDVEGNETEVLRGMRRTLMAHRPRVVLVETVEANLRRAGSSRVELTELMRELGYVPDHDVDGEQRLDTVFVPVDGITH